MGYEADFLPVGEGQKSGDAIAFRFGDLHGRRSDQFVGVIDGGTKDSGSKLVEHIQTHYKTDRIDLVVSTHPDADHASGLTEVMENLQVDLLWMHKPWEHAEEVRRMFRSGRITDASLRASLQEALQNACDLDALAQRLGIPVLEPFSDRSLPFADKGIRVLGPSRAVYCELIPHFRETPTARTAPGLFERIRSNADNIIQRVAEHWGIETLEDPDDTDTSAENNTSAILSITVDGRQLLFTGDAGALALGHALDTADATGVSFDNLHVLQVPHHGSRHNIGPTILNRLLGPRQATHIHRRTAVISVATEGEKTNHPSRKVVNALKRRQCEVYATKGGAICHYRDAPDRGWGSASPLPFYDTVED